MAHETQVKGKLSEMTTTQALLANGWEVSIPSLDEIYDLVARDPFNGEWKTVQVKTIRRRKDRNNEMVIYASNGSGNAYQPQDCDYIVGVEGDTAYMVECKGIKEYWATDMAASKRWIKMTADDFIVPEGMIR